MPPEISIDTDEHSVGAEVLLANESAFTSDVCSWLTADHWVVSGVVECI